MQRFSISFAPTLFFSKLMSDFFSFSQFISAVVNYAGGNARPCQTE